MSIKVDIVTLIDIITLLQGSLLGLILISNSRKKYPSLFLGFFIITYTIEIFNSIIEDTGILENHPVLLFLPLNFYFLSVPLLYLYLKKLTALVSIRKTFIVLIPGISEFVIFVSLFILPSQTKLDILQNPQYTIFYKAYLFISLLFSIFYAGKILIIIKNHEKNVLNYYSYTEKKLLNWIRYVALFIIIYYTINLMFLSLVINDSNNYSTFVYTLLSFINVIFIYWVGINGLRQPVASVTSMDYKDKPTAIKEKEAKMETSEADDSLYAKLIELMIDQKPYKNPDLTLVLLANEMNISREHLSKLINKHAQVNFNTFINQYRIEEAKQLLLDSKYDHFNLTGIALEAGFKSRSTFFTVFKKITHITPKKYISNTAN